MQPMVRLVVIIVAVAALLAGAVLIGATRWEAPPLPPESPGALPGIIPDTPRPDIPGTSPGITPDLTFPTPSGPPGFTLLATPVEVRARPGEVVTYTLTIEPRGGFDAPVSLRLDVNVLFLYRNSFDLGTVSPPYPRTVQYPFMVPSDVPLGITVKGVLSGEGGGHRDACDLILIIR